MEREQTSDTHGLMQLDRPDYFSSKSTFLLTITLSHFLRPPPFFSALNLWLHKPTALSLLSS